MPRVNIIHGSDRRQNVFKVLEEISNEVRERILDAETILIKVNLVHHKNQLASTHADAVRGVIDFIRTMSKAHIIVGDSGYHGTKKAFENFGYYFLEKEYQRVELLDLNDDETVDGYHSVRADKSENQIRVSKTAVEADFKVSLTTMKTHRDTGVTLSVKNWSVGTWIPPRRVGATGWTWARWPWLHSEGPWAHHKSIAELYKQLRPDLSVIDGFRAMEGDGPTRGQPVTMQLAIAGTDGVAVDAVACSLMGIDPTEIGYLHFLAEDGVGEIDMTKIDAPVRVLAEERREFKKPDTWDNHVLAWREANKPLSISDKTY